GRRRFLNVGIRRSTSINHPSFMSTANWKWFAGGEVDECSLLLRFFGDDLDPDAITALLGVPPTIAARKGEPLSNSTVTRPARTGMWLLDCERTDDTPDSQVELLFGDLADDLVVWNKLAEAYLAELKCHLFLRRWN